MHAFQWEVVGSFTDLCHCRTIKLVVAHSFSDFKKHQMYFGKRNMAIKILGVNCISMKHPLIISTMSDIAEVLPKYKCQPGIHCFYRVETVHTSNAAFAQVITSRETRQLCDDNIKTCRRAVWDVARMVCSQRNDGRITHLLFVFLWNECVAAHTSIIHKALVGKTCRSSRSLNKKLSMGHPLAAAHYI